MQMTRYVTVLALASLFAVVPSLGERPDTGFVRVDRDAGEPDPDPELPRQFLMEEYLDGDGDGDGVTNRDDLCWHTPPGGNPLTEGCAALDILEMPDPLSAEPARLIGESVSYMESMGGLEDLIATLGQAGRQIRSAIRETRGGDPCTGFRSFFQASGALADVESDLEARIIRARTAAGPPTSAQDDVRPEDGPEALLFFIKSILGRARERTEELETLTTQVCRLSAAGPVTTTGQIAAVDDALGRLRLTDGRTIGLPDGSVDGDLAQGVTVKMDQVDFGDGSGFALTAAPDSPATIKFNPRLSCIQPRAVPIQAFPPFSFGPFTRHHFDAYKYVSQALGTEVVRLEHGMRLGVDQVCGRNSSTGRAVSTKFKRYSVSFRLEYFNFDGFPLTFRAYDVDPVTTPVPLPSDVSGLFEATLTVKHRIQDCDRVSGSPIAVCGPLTVLGESVHPLQVVPRGSMCFVAYETRKFAVDDRFPEAIQPASVAGLLSSAVGDGGAPPSFLGEAYRYISPGGGLPNSSSYPIRYFINNAAPFAIHSHDFRPIFRSLTAGEDEMYLLATGMDHAAGMSWPRAVGYRNGFNYQYSCTMPEIVRDVVDFCPGSGVDSYYRMPFAETDTAWSQSQGNLSDPGCVGDDCRTHANGYAYDMLAGCGTTVLAARAGRVIMARETGNTQGEKWCCSGEPRCSGCTPFCNDCLFDTCAQNELWIQHEDGSIGRYVHMPQNGIFPEVGDVVRRGEPVALVGLTGNTSGPHLHFEERDSSGTSLALFQAPPPIGPGTLRCYEPKEGETLRSNNKLCSGCLPQ